MKIRVTRSVRVTRTNFALSNDVADDFLPVVFNFSGVGDDNPAFVKTIQQIYSSEPPTYHLAG